MATGPRSSPDVQVESSTDAHTDAPRGRGNLNSLPHVRPIPQVETGWAGPHCPPDRPVQPELRRHRPIGGQRGGLRLSATTSDRRRYLKRTGREDAEGPAETCSTGPPGARESLAADHLMILVTRPEPTVRPPSRMAKPRPSSMAIGWISSTVISVLSPGMTISVPSGSSMTPVTSVVRK